MDVRLSTEQQALEDAAIRLVDDLGPGTVGGLDDAERAARLDKAVDAAGWRDLRADQGNGEPWASGVEACVVAEQLGRQVADTAYVGPTLAAELRRLAGAPAADRPETVLMTADLAAPASSDGLRVPDSALAVDALGAEIALFLVADGPGWGLAYAPVGGSGDPAVGVDLTRTIASVEPGSATAVTDRTGTLDAEDLERITALGLALTCADLVGIMQGAVDLAAGYAAERNQYGQPVGAFQAVQHLLADALVATEGSRSLALNAAWSIDAETPARARAAASVAKTYCARAARQVCETAIQVHGGIGNTWECLAHVQLRRSLLSSDLFGGVEAGLEQVLADRLAPGSTSTRPSETPIP